MESSPLAAVVDGARPVPHGFAREGALRFYHRGRPDFDLRGDGHLGGRSDEYRIFWYGPDGKVERVFSLAQEPLPLTHEDRLIIRGRWDVDLQRYPSTPPERVAALKSSLRFEGTYPAYRRFMCGPAATVLVQRVRPVRDPADGTWYMYSVWSDERDVEYVAAWRIDGGVPARAEDSGPGGA